MGEFFRDVSTAGWDATIRDRLVPMVRGRTGTLVGVQGLAPYWLEVDANLRLSEGGDVPADLPGALAIMTGSRVGG